MEPDWAAAAYERWVLKGDKNFFSELKLFRVLSPQIIQNITHKYETYFTNESLIKKILLRNLNV